MASDECLCSRQPDFRAQDEKEKEFRGTHDQFRSDCRSSIKHLFATSFAAQPLAGHDPAFLKQQNVENNITAT
jgi:hypothetical protein